MREGVIVPFCRSLWHRECTAGAYASNPVTSIVTPGTSAGASGGAGANSTLTNGVSGLTNNGKLVLAQTADAGNGGTGGAKLRVIDADAVAGAALDEHLVPGAGEFAPQLQIHVNCLARSGAQA